MRIAFITTTLDLTVGWGRHAAGFLSEARRRHGDGVIAPDPEGLRSAAIRWHQPFWALADAWKLRRALKGVDVIHAAIEPAAPLAFFLSLLLRRPYVVSACGTFADPRSYSWPVRWLYRLAFRHAGRVTVISRYTLGVFTRGIRGARTVIVHAGFDPAPSATPGPRAASEVPRLLSVGAVKRRKGFHTLVEALGLLKARGLEVQADILGPKDSTGYVEALDRRVSELGLGDRVRFAGRVPEAELHAAYAAADLFVLPSEHDGTAFEGLGLVYLEAMAYGVPAIGCLDSGAEDVIQDGVNGLLVPPGDAGRLAEAIARLLEDGAFRRKLADAAPASIARFRWEAVGADMDAAYHSAISDHGR